MLVILGTSNREITLVKEWQLVKIHPAFRKLEVGWISVSRNPTITVLAHTRDEEVV